MHYIKQTGLNDNKLKKKLTVSAFLFCFIIIFLLSEIFILTRANHRRICGCPTGSCATCAQIAAAESLLEQLSEVLLAVKFILTCFSAATLIFIPVSSQTGFFPLVKLKVRMNN